MSNIIEALTAAANGRKGENIAGLIQWAVMHIQDQDAALKEAREEAETEQNERIRLERALHEVEQLVDASLARVRDAKSVVVTLARDFAPHKNIMAHHGVEPYAKKKRSTPVNRSGK
jgi:hypothetical protein